MGIPKPPPTLKAENRTRYIYEAALNVVSRKVDIVVKTDNETWIIEVKRRLDPGAIGQVMSYRELYDQTFPNDGRRHRMGIVCEIDDPMIRRVAEAQGITIFVLPPSK